MNGLGNSKGSNPVGIWCRRCDVSRRIDVDTTSFLRHVPSGNGSQNMSNMGDSLRPPHRILCKRYLDFFYFLHFFSSRMCNIEKIKLQRKEPYLGLKIHVPWNYRSHLSNRYSGRDKLYTRKGLVTKSLTH